MLLLRLVLTLALMAAVQGAVTRLTVNKVATGSLGSYASQTFSLVLPAHNGTTTAYVQLMRTTAVPRRFHSELDESVSHVRHPTPAPLRPRS